ncbi:hypothetical protein GMJLKIPL_4909 [Methylobacterium isbiliense]|uniref:Uncharacterized protein n=1 Tax=Methylobacterium isbiliense TaxID=315478 RepID=A0ABQ4SK97_9HYPH|nr:hypothetical protein GMJLKIPL_4909 [Methylobacterium isbiliense]
MAEIHDRGNGQPLQLGKSLVRKGPVVAVRPEVDAVVGRSPAQIFQAELADEAEVLTPPVVMARLRHLVDALNAPIAPKNRWVTVLDSRREEERHERPHRTGADCLLLLIEHGVT